MSSEMLWEPRSLLLLWLGTLPHSLVAKVVGFLAVLLEPPKHVAFLLICLTILLYLIKVIQCWPIHHQDKGDIIENNNYNKIIKYFKSY